jgi:hypothetical protein
MQFLLLVMLRAERTLPLMVTTFLRHPHTNAVSDILVTLPQRTWTPNASLALLSGISPILNFFSQF